MAFFYRVDFDILPEQMNELSIGASLERVLGYLRTLLPGSPGFITVRAAYSIDSKKRTSLMVESEWDSWEELREHQKSSLAEDKVLKEFDPQIVHDDLTIRLYAEVD